MSDELTVDSAKEELEKIKVWRETLAQMQQQHAQVMIRSGYLQGFLKGQGVDDSAEEVPEPTPAPAKRPSKR